MRRRARIFFPIPDNIIAFKFWWVMVFNSTIVQLYGGGGKTIIRISNVEFKTYLPEACTNC
jgi:hypothetical protein